MEPEGSGDRQGRLAQRVAVVHLLPENTTRAYVCMRMRANGYHRRPPTLRWAQTAPHSSIVSTSSKSPSRAERSRSRFRSSVYDCSAGRLMHMCMHKCACSRVWSGGFTSSSRSLSRVSSKGEPRAGRCDRKLRKFSVSRASIPPRRVFRRPDGPPVNPPF